MSATFLQSALTLENRFQSLDQTLSWLQELQNRPGNVTTPVPFSELQGWYFHPETGDLHHQSGKFFVVEGVRIETNFPPVPFWEQPIVRQSEIGILGFISKVFDGVRYFLVQAKMEPGYVNKVQLAPTLQATFSNYTMIHKGRAPKYLEYFTKLGMSQTRIIMDQLQSEQGARFLGKCNRNIIIDVEGDVPLFEEFKWLTLGEIKQLLQADDLVNMDSRTVLAGVQFERAKSAAPSALSDFGRELYGSLNQQRENMSVDDILQWLMSLKKRYFMMRNTLALKDVKNWRIGTHDISHESGRFFSVIAVSVQANNREVPAWTQPILKHDDLGLVGFLAKKIDGVLHFLMQAKVEAGLIDVLELAPTVNVYGINRPGSHEHVPFFREIHEPDPSRIRLSSLQSEEGGRFYKLRNLYRVVEIPESDNPALPENFRWMSLSQLLQLIRYRNHLNVDTRSLLACLDFLPKRKIS